MSITKSCIVIIMVERGGFDPNTQFRKPLLYPPELQGHILVFPFCSLPFPPMVTLGTLIDAVDRPRKFMAFELTSYESTVSFPASRAFVSLRVWRSLTSRVNYQLLIYRGYP